MIRDQTFTYSQRYPRSFARYQPECIGVDQACSRAQLINTFDNSVLYTDSFIDKVIDQVRDKKALVFYAADHGESIDENYHLHGTPRDMAPSARSIAMKNCTIPCWDAWGTRSPNGGIKAENNWCQKPSAAQPAVTVNRG